MEHRKACRRPGCDGTIVVHRPSELTIRQYCSKACANRRERFQFTDVELLAELRRRADWNTGSLTMSNVLSAAADRLEDLLAQQKGQAA